MQWSVFTCKISLELMGTHLADEICGLLKILYKHVLHILSCAVPKQRAYSQTQVSAPGLDS